MVNGDIVVGDSTWDAPVVGALETDDKLLHRMHRPVSGRYCRQVSLLDPLPASAFPHSICALGRRAFLEVSPNRREHAGDRLWGRVRIERGPAMSLPAQKK